MAKKRKVIITCAVTGSIHTPSMSPHLPVTPDEIAQEGIAAVDAGAASFICMRAIRKTAVRAPTRTFS